VLEQRIHGWSKSSNAHIVNGANILHAYPLVFIADDISDSLNGKKDGVCSLYWQAAS